MKIPPSSGSRVRSNRDGRRQKFVCDFVSRSFEELCCSALRSLYPEYTITKTGQWWYGEHEVDVVGLSAGETLITGECKFQQSPLGYDALSKLERHVDELRWTPDGTTSRVEEHALFSRSGFKRSVEEAATEREDLRLFTVDDVVTAEAGRKPTALALSLTHKLRHQSRAIHRRVAIEIPVFSAFRRVKSVIVDPNAVDSSTTLRTERRSRLSSCGSQLVLARLESFRNATFAGLRRMGKRQDFSRGRSQCAE